MASCPNNPPGQTLQTRVVKQWPARAPCPSAQYQKQMAWPVPPMTQRSNTSIIKVPLNLPLHLDMKPRPRPTSKQSAWSAMSATNNDKDKQHMHLQTLLPPSFEALPPHCSGEDYETELKSGMDEDNAPVFLSRLKQLRQRATQDMPPRKNRNSQERLDRKNTARQKKKHPQQLLRLMHLVRELQTPTQKAARAQKSSSPETEEEQPQMTATEAAAEPEEEQEEVDQMRDTDEGSAGRQPTREQRANCPPGYEIWSSS